MMTNILRITILALLSLCIAGQSVLAKPKCKTKDKSKCARKNSAAKRVNRKDKKQADKYFKQGLQQVEKKEHTKALEAFSNAYKLAPHPLVLYNIAGAHRQLGQYQDALRVYNQFLLEGDAQLSKAMLDRGKRELEDLLSLVSRIQLSTTPQGADISLDGKPYGTSPLPDQLVVKPGLHTIDISKEGFQPSSRRLRTTPGSNQDLHITLLSAEEADPKSTLQSNSDSTDKKSANNDSTNKVKRSTEQSTAFTMSESLALRTGFGTNLLKLSTTGAPSIGIAYPIHQRVRLTLDAILLAYALLPQVQIRLFGQTLPISLVLALPLSWDSNQDNDPFFVSGSAGLSTDYKLTKAVGIYLTSMMSYSGKTRGSALQLYLGLSYWL